MIKAPDQTTPPYGHPSPLLLRRGMKIPEKRGRR